MADGGARPRRVTAGRGGRTCCARAAAAGCPRRRSACRATGSRAAPAARPSATETYTPLVLAVS